jgi:hypothetical protein
MKAHSRLLSFCSAVLIASSFVGGCSSKKEEEYGNKKEDYVVQPPPAGWRSPDDPAGPGFTPAKQKTPAKSETTDQTQ